MSASSCSTHVSNCAAANAQTPKDKNDDLQRFLFIHKSMTSIPHTMDPIARTEQLKEIYLKQCIVPMNINYERIDWNKYRAEGIQLCECYFLVAKWFIRHWTDYKQARNQFETVHKCLEDIETITELIDDYQINPSTYYFHAVLYQYQGPDSLPDAIKYFTLFVQTSTNERRINAAKACISLMKQHHDDWSDYNVVRIDPGFDTLGWNRIAHKQSWDRYHQTPRECAIL
eukprot:419298_1